MASFTIRGDQFELDGEPFRVLSGAMHYFRIVPEYWVDRMTKLKAMGLNTLETYVAWNVHEPSPGRFRFDGGADLVRYIGIAGDLGLKVIVRPGPYICSEWDLGGLPSWLLADSSMRLRCNYPPYLEAVDRYFGELLPRLAPLQITRGGPVIAMQVENEYGSYGNDHEYLAHLEHTMRDSGIDVLLFTSDGPTDVMLQYGTLPHVLKTVNFGSRPDEAYEKLAEYQPDGPRMCMEFWNGWFDHWGEEHHTREVSDAAEALERQLSLGASVNLYMFHGGTNFGFMNGANHGGHYQPTVSSYDDDAPLSEHGAITPKYRTFREVIGRYLVLPPFEEPPAVETMSVAPFALTESTALDATLARLSDPVTRATPDPMEYLGQDYGFILYETTISGPREESTLTIRELHDRGYVIVDGKLVSILDRESGSMSLSLTIPREGITLRILVENMGRINYGSLLADRKGITEAVLLGQQILYGWTIYPLPLADLSKIEYGSGDGFENGWPTFYRGTFEVKEVRDTFVFPKGWRKGICWVNGRNLGRYWDRGPQQTLYLPAPFLKQGRNEIVLFELERPETNRMVSCIDTAKL